MKKNYLLLTLMVSSMAVCAQKSNLQIGDKLPDIYLGKFMDQPQKKMRLSQVKAKLLVLDFWNTRCSVCLHDMPRMDSLQKEFGGQLSIISITRNSAKEARELFSKIKMKRPDYPFVVADTIFGRFFPHNGDPIHIWIDEKRVVRAITFYYNTNSKTVSKFLSGEDPKLARRWDFGFDGQYSLLSQKNSPLLGMAKNYSVLLDNMEQHTGDNFMRINSDHIQLVNSSLLDLFKIAYVQDLYGFKVSPFDLFANNRVAIEVTNNYRFFPPKDRSETDAWSSINSYGYELQVPANDSENIFRYMRQDLDRYFPYSAHIEKRKTKSLALIVTNPAAIPLSVDPQSTPLIDDQSDSSTLILRNEPIKSLVSAIFRNNSLNNFPLVDQTGLESPIDLTLRSPLYDLSALKKELQTHGFDLVEGEWEINILVIKDKL